jgi:hypothetical protein
MHLQATRWIALARVDSLGRGHKRCTMCFELANKLREMLQAATKPV